MEQKEKATEKSWWVEVEGTYIESWVVVAETEEEAKEKALLGLGVIDSEERSGARIYHIEEMEDE